MIIFWQIVDLIPQHDMVSSLILPQTNQHIHQTLPIFTSQASFLVTLFIILFFLLSC